MTENASVQPFDRKLVERRQRRAASSGIAVDFLAKAVAEDLALRLSAVERSFERGVDLHSATDDMADLALKTGRVKSLMRAQSAADWLTASGIVCDQEALPLAPASVDLAISCLGLQWVNDLAGTLVQIRQALKGDGLLLMAMVGGESLTELRQSLVEAESEIRGGAAPRVAPMVDIRSLGMLAGRAGLALPVCDIDTLTVRYDTIFGLMRDLRGMAATNPLNDRSRKPLRRDVLMRAAQIYAERFSDPDGRIRARFDILHLSAWAPHPSQQQPLKPGSAKMRLADALKTK